jgi:hypothetical protein
MPLRQPPPPSLLLPLRFHTTQRSSQVLIYSVRLGLLIGRVVMGFYGASCFMGFVFRNHTVQRRRSQHARTHPYEYTYANPTPLSNSEGLSTCRSGDSRSHHWRLVVNGNITYHLMHNAYKSWKIQEKVRARTRVGSVPLDRSTIGLQAQSRFMGCVWWVEMSFLYLMGWDELDIRQMRVGWVECEVLRSGFWHETHV